MNMEEAREALVKAFPGRHCVLREIVTMFTNGEYDTVYYLTMYSRPGKQELIQAGSIDLNKLVANVIAEHGEAKP